MKSLLLGALASLGLAGPGLAQESVSHIYAGAMLGQAHWRSGCLASSPSCDDSDTALRVFGGYQINRILSAEVGFHNLSKAVGTTATVKCTAWEAVGVAAGQGNQLWADLRLRRPTRRQPQRRAARRVAELSGARRQQPTEDGHQRNEPRRPLALSLAA
jgi:hypothetical protein